MREFYISEKELQSAIVVMARTNLDAFCDHYCADLLEYSGIFILPLSLFEGLFILHYFYCMFQKWQAAVSIFSYLRLMN